MAQALIAKSDAYMAVLYPLESNHMEGVQALALPSVLFLGGYIEGELVACGAVKTLTDGACSLGESHVKCRNTLR